MSALDDAIKAALEEHRQSREALRRKVEELKQMVEENHFAERILKEMKRAEHG